ncbi:hypothetical protein BH10ACT3_BH10ACT3_16170 [soil metagenome]
MAVQTPVPIEIVEQVRSICLAFPDAYEEPAWVGTRWRIRTRTFAHVLTIDQGRPEGYARVVGLVGPVVVLMFRSADPELGVLRDTGHPFFAPPWRPDEVGLIVGDLTRAEADWAEIGELLTESYCAQAPKKLARLVERPAG